MCVMVLAFVQTVEVVVNAMCAMAQVSAHHVVALVDVITVMVGDVNTAISLESAVYARAQVSAQPVVVLAYVQHAVDLENVQTVMALVFVQYVEGVGFARNVMAQVIWILLRWYALDVMAGGICNGYQRICEC